MAERARSSKKKAAAKGAVKGKPIATLPKGKKGKRGMGDNSMHAVPDETILTAINMLRTKKRAMKKIQEELDQAKGVYRSARKKAKGDGLNLDAFDLVEALETQDQGKVLVDHADAGRYLRLTDSALATQMELFQNLQEPAPVVDVALQGQNAGKGGEPEENNPYPANTDEFVIWRENHAVGVGQVVKAMSKGEKAALN